MVISVSLASSPVLVISVILVITAVSKIDVKLENLCSVGEGCFLGWQLLHGKSFHVGSLTKYKHPQGFWVVVTKNEEALVIPTH